MTVVRQPLDRLQFRPFRFDSENDATIHRHTVHQNCAGTAIAIVAALFGTGQPQRLPQHFQQTLPGLAQEFDRFAVDRRCDMQFLGHQELSLRRRKGSNVERGVRLTFESIATRQKRRTWEFISPSGLPDNAWGKIAGSWNAIREQFREIEDGQHT